MTDSKSSFYMGTPNNSLHTALRSICPSSALAHDNTSPASPAVLRLDLGQIDSQSGVQAVIRGSRKSNIVDLQKEYQDIFLDLDGDLTGRVLTQEQLNNSTAIYHGDVVGMGFLPKLYDGAAFEYFDQIVATTYGILEKVTNHYLASPAYRRLFGFSPLLEHLICLPTGYQCTIPIARIDIFLDENSGDFKFCEFNTDGSSAMNEDREICNALAQSNVYQEFAKSHRIHAQELFDTWVERFMEIYRSSSMAIANPTIAIVDYKGSSTPDEHREFCNRFRHFGVKCLVADIKDLEYRNGELFAVDVDDSGNQEATKLKVDVVYRRAVTFEIIDELQKLPAEKIANLIGGEATTDTLVGALALAKAASEGAVCIIGGFKTQVAHSKAIYCVLHQEQTLELLTPGEQEFVKAHVPYTTWLQSRYIDLQSVKAHKDDWIIKPDDGYGTVGVFAGKALSQPEWDKLIDKHSNGSYIIQEYCPQFQSLNTLPIPVDQSFHPKYSSLEQLTQAAGNGEFLSTDLQPYNILTGLFSYQGRFNGSYIRSGRHALIVGFHGGITLGSFLVDYPDDSSLAVVPREL